jgi:tryptophanyl-tRNA synthetase
MSDDPTINASERIELKNLLVEMTKIFQQNDDNKEVMKDLAKAAEEKFGIKKKLITKLAKTMYKHNYADLQQENEHFSYLYESLVEGKKS